MPITAEQVQQLIAPLFPGTLGVQITEARPDCVRATLRVRPELCTAGGT